MRPPSDLPSRRPRVRRFQVSSKWRIVMAVVAVVLVVLILSARSLAGFYVDALWFKSVDHSEVFWGVLRAKIFLAVACTLIFAVLTYLSLSIADRVAPTVRASGPEEEVLERVRSFIEPRQRLVRLGIALLFGLIAGVPAAAHWRDWFLFRNSVSFGVKDPQFGEDVSWYVFRLPFLNFIIGWAFAALVVVTLLTTVVHYLNGGIRTSGAVGRVTPQVKLHLSVLLAAVAILKAAQYWLRRYSLTTSKRGFVEGAGYTDVNAQLPALNLLILISLAAAVLLIWNVRQRGWRLPVIAVGLWAVVALVAGTVYPTLVQRFRVQPSESTRESEYIRRNIEATRRAMGLDSVEVRDITIGTVDRAQAEAAVPALAEARLIDPSIMGSRFQVDQEREQFYAIDDVDVDRYVLDGRVQQVALAARQLNQKGAQVQTWEARHLAYTHGYGIVAAPASQATAEGRPDYAIGAAGIPVAEPGLYFGEGLGNYAVVKTNRAGGEESLDPTKPSYAGNGGVRLSSPLRRVAFALHFGEYNLFGSKLISEDSRIIYNRDIRNRVEKVAPFLDFDADPYPVVVGGRVLWVLDGYTTTSHYPYAESADRKQLPLGTGLDHDFNYVRNSVKVTIDAYEGTTTLYLVDTEDPIVLAWSKVFPDLFTPVSEAPAELVAHFRYPEDLFRVQTNRYARYQIDQPDPFYTLAGAWSVAQEAPATQSGQSTPALTAGSSETSSTRQGDANTLRFDPYYTLFRPPGSTDPAEFVLLRPFVPYSKDDKRRELQAVMTASSDPDSYGKLVVYRIASPLPDGPLKVAAQISEQLAADLTLLDQAGSNVSFGDLQLIPAGSGFIYLRPLFVTAQTNGVPALNSITLTLGDRTVRGTTTGEALAKLFPGLNVDVGDRTGTTTPDGTTPTDPSAPIEADTVETLLVRANQAFAEAAVALKAGDLGTYQKKVTEAEQLTTRAYELATGNSTSTTTPPTTVTPTTTAPSG